MWALRFRGASLRWSLVGGLRRPQTRGLFQSPQRSQSFFDVSERKGGFEWDDVLKEDKPKRPKTPSNTDRESEFAREMRVLSSTGDWQRMEERIAAIESDGADAVDRLALRNLAFAYGRDGQVEKAEKLLRECLKTYKMPPDNRMLLSTLSAMSLQNQSANTLKSLCKEMLEEHHVNPCVACMSMVLRAYSTEKDIDGVNGVLDWMEELQIEPNHVVLGSIVVAYRDVGRIEEALPIVDAVTERIEGDDSLYSVTYALLIDGLCRSGQVERAVDFFDKHHATIGADFACISSILHALTKHATLEEAENFVLAMNEKYGIQPTIGLVNVIIKAHAELHASNGASKARSLCDQLGLEYDLLTVSTLTSRLLRRGLVNAAKEVLQNYTGPLDAKLFGPFVLNALLKKKFTWIEGYFEEMEELGVTPDEVLWSYRLQGAKAAGSSDDVERIQKAVKDLGLTLPAIPEKKNYSKIRGSRGRGRGGGSGAGGGRGGGSGSGSNRGGVQYRGRGDTRGRKRDGEWNQTDIKRG